MAINNATVVLVHGGWADGSSWAKVIMALATSGVKAVAAPLPLTSFQDDVAALNRTLERAEGPVVLAGHAYAGGVIGATRSEQVKALVYVAAVAPDEGETAHRRVLPRHAASRGAEARAGRARSDLSARSGLPRGLRAKCFQRRLAVLAAVQRPLFTCMHHRRCAAAALEGSARLVPHRRA